MNTNNTFDIHEISPEALQGLGGGGLMTLSQALISENVPPRQRAQFQGYFAGVFAVSSTLGPLLGAAVLLPPPPPHAAASIESAIANAASLRIFPSMSSTP